MIEVTQLEPKTYSEDVTYELPCSKIKPIGDGVQVINNSSFLIVDSTDLLTDLSATMLDTVSYSTIDMTITARIKPSVGTKGRTYWLVGLVSTDSGNKYKRFGKFKIEDKIGPDITQ